MKQLGIILLLFLSLTSFAQKRRFNNNFEQNGDTLLLHVSYVYDDPDSMDEEFGQTTTIKLINRKKIQERIEYSFPSKTVIGIEETWDLESNSKRKINGTVEILSLLKDKVEAYLVINDPIKKKEGRFVFKPR